MSVRTLATYRLVPVSLLLSLAGCKTWEPAPTTPQSLIADAQPSSVRITSADGLRVTLKNPIFINDSIVSAVAPPPGVFVVPPRAGIPLDDVNSLEVARFSPGRTIALVGAIAAASITWARVQQSAGGSEERPDPLPKDPALDLIGVFRLLWGSF